MFLLKNVSIHKTIKGRYAKRLLQIIISCYSITQYMPIYRVTRSKNCYYIRDNFNYIFKLPSVSSSTVK